MDVARRLLMHAFMLRTLTASAAILVVVAVARPSRADDPPARVRIDADDPRAILSMRVGTGLVDGGPYTRMRYGTVWQDVCATPCNREVDSTRTYRIEGEGIWPSDGFRLSPGPANLHVKAGSRSGVIGGAFLTLLGGGLTLMGGLVLGFSTLPVDPGSPDAQKQRDAKATFLTIGIVQLAVGIVSLAAGIPLWASSTTSVTDDSGRTVGQLRPAWTF